MSTEQQDKNQDTSEQTEETSTSENLSVETPKTAEEKTDTKEVQKNDDGKKGTTKKTIYPNIIPGATVRVYQKIKEKKGKEIKERIQIFEGIVLARKHGNQSGATITVQKIAKGNFGVEKIYPLYSPLIDKIEIVKQAVVRKSKLGFLRTSKKNLKTKKEK